MRLIASGFTESHIASAKESGCLQLKSSKNGCFPEKRVQRIIPAENTSDLNSGNPASCSGAIYAYYNEQSAYSARECSCKVNSSTQQLRCTKINEFDLYFILIYFHHDIIWFDISVQNIPRMNIANSREQLSHDLSNCELIENLDIIQDVLIE